MIDKLIHLKVDRMIYNRHNIQNAKCTYESKHMLVASEEYY
jgi:hypothetical protein